ncbi:MAG TPA: DUF885 domain-containing protein [Gemmatimonadales bacterium]|nr:DUF885 domain-containing protein [Gemmatimonadales bacterium]
MTRHSLAVLLLTLATRATGSAQGPVASFSARYAALIANPRHVADSTRLHELFQINWEYRMTEFPEFATAVGYPGHNGRWTDVSLEAIARRKRELAEPLAVVKSIRRARLSAADRLNYDLFKRDLDEQIAATRFPDELLAITQLGGVQQDVGQILSITPSVRAGDYESIVARLNAVPALIDQTLVLLQKGLDSGITPPRVTLRDVPQQIRELIPDSALASPLLQPFTSFPDAISPADRARLTAAAVEAYTRRVAPAYRKLSDYFVGTYLPRTRETIGMSALPDGAAWYALRVHQFTTTSLTPGEIHELGLREVRRIRAAMDSVIASTGFRGSFAEFAQFLRTDPQFFYTDSASLVRGFREIAKRIDPGLIRLFGKLPRLPYGVTTIPSYTARSQTGAYYLVGSPEAGRPGWFYVNTYNLKSRPKWVMEVLTLHEAVPGHHLQLALAEEMPGVPDFRRYGDYTAFVEGWGLYAEGLGPELGMYQDPYSKFGQLTYEMWRAVRLVIDTGIHALGWSRDQALQFFRDNVPLSEQEITVEVDRYIVNPGQALAYKIGQLKFRALRDTAAAALGSRFDVRAFHDEVLRNGALPLDVLEAEARQWLPEQTREKGPAGVPGRRMRM